jgi:hypothetical protein
MKIGIDGLGTTSRGRTRLIVRITVQTGNQSLRAFTTTARSRASSKYFAACDPYVRQAHAISIEEAYRFVNVMECDCRNR